MFFKRKLRYSLRAALVVFTLFCLLIAWYAETLRRERAFARIEALGGNYMLVDNVPALSDEVSHGQVIEVSFLGPRISDAEIETLLNSLWVFPNLERLSLVDTAVSREGEYRLRSKLQDIELQVIRTVWERPEAPGIPRGIR